MKHTAKLSFLILLSFYLNQAIAQRSTVIKAQGKFGLESLDSYGRKMQPAIPPVYDLLYVPATGVATNKLAMGSLYLSVKNWVDTDFVETPTDPNDPTITKIDTIVNFDKLVEIRKTIIAYKENKCGLIDFSGNVKAPLEYDSIKVFDGNYYLLDRERADQPYMLLYKSGNFSVCDNQGKMLIPADFSPILNLKLSAAAKLKVLEFGFFDKFIIVGDGAQVLTQTFYDTTFVKVKTAKGLKNQKLISSYEYTYLAGGKYNFYDITLSNYSSPKWCREIVIDAGANNKGEPMIIKFTDPVFAQNAFLVSKFKNKNYKVLYND